MICFVCTERHLYYIYCISKVVIYLIVMLTCYLEVEYWQCFGKFSEHPCTFPFRKHKEPSFRKSFAM